MRITCPNCGTGYEVADTAVGAQGRKVRCRACGASWVEAGRGGVALPEALAPPVVVAPEVAAAAPVASVATAAEPVAEPVAEAPAPPIVEAEEEEPAPPRRLRAPLIALALVIVAVVLGIAVAGAIMGPQQLASEFGIGARRVPLGIAITRPPDWREMGGGNQLFAISGRIWNPTAQTQPVPDVLAEIRDKAGKPVHQWTIARPAKELAPGAHVDFDGAAIDVPRDSATVVLSFVGEKK